MHGHLHVQLGELTAIVRELGFGDYEVGQLQAQTVSGFPVSAMGSGLRAVFPILAAITNPKLTTIFIDEPEFALEARIQKRLRELFLQKAAEGKHIIVATHSHLMVNRGSIGHNYRVDRVEGLTTVRQLASESEMLEVSFNLLGNSPSDLFFPENFLIVEGASDQIIAERVRDLCDISASQVKVLAATSSSQLRGLEEAIVTALRPLMAKHSPYHEKVVCLIDKPDGRNLKPIEKLRTTLKNRLVELDQYSLEEYLPSDLYALAGMDKASVLEEIVLARRTGDHRKAFAIKADISSGIAGKLRRDHLGSLQLIVHAIEKAADIPARQGSELLPR